MHAPGLQGGGGGGVMTAEYIGFARSEYSAHLIIAKSHIILCRWWAVEDRCESKSLLVL